MLLFQVPDRERDSVGRWRSGELSIILIQFRWLLLILLLFANVAVFVRSGEVQNGNHSADFGAVGLFQVFSGYRSREIQDGNHSADLCALDLFQVLPGYRAQACEGQCLGSCGYNIPISQMP